MTTALCLLKLARNWWKLGSCFRCPLDRLDKIWKNWHKQASQLTMHDRAEAVSEFDIPGHPSPAIIGAHDHSKNGSQANPGDGMQAFKGNWGNHFTYDINKQLGKTGGFGSVYRGNLLDGTAVAVKAISKTMPGGDAIDQRLLHRELDIAEKLRHQEHEHLIAVLDVAESEKCYFIVMELAQHNLAEIIASGKGESEAIEILKHIIAGLYELHQAAVIHRDLKPPNILFSQWKWKLSDFGIARDAGLGTGNPTFQGWGTAAYMAPELWENRSPTFKSDLYALGCVTMELLTGKTPFPGPDFRMQHMQMPIPKLPAVNPALADLILRLLNKDPAVRPQDSRAVKERLAHIALPLSEDQLNLQRLSAIHAEERMKETAAKMAKKAEDDRFVAWQQQGRADLAEICADALVALQAALPDISEFKETGSDFSVRSPDAALHFRIWNRGIISSDDIMPMAGEIVGFSRKFQRSPFILANIVYEQIAGRFEWRLYLFRANPLVAHYKYGPTDIEHGFGMNLFLEERKYMLMHALHVWTVKKEPLTSESIVPLFGRVLAL